MTNFYNDLRIGKIYENKAMEILPELGFTDLYLYEGYEPRYDIRGTYNNVTVYVEVKFNNKADITDNFIIELIKDDLKSGGLFFSEANYYMLFSKTRYYLIEKKKLYTLIKKNIDVKNKKQLLKRIDYSCPIFFGYYCIKLKIKRIIKKSLKCDDF